MSAHHRKHKGTLKAYLTELNCSEEKICDPDYVTSWKRQSRPAGAVEGDRRAWKTRIFILLRPVLPLDFGGFEVTTSSLAGCQLGWDPGCWRTPGHWVLPGQSSHSSHTVLSFPFVHQNHSSYTATAGLPHGSLSLSPPSLRFPALRSSSLQPFGSVSSFPRRGRVGVQTET